MRSCGATIRSSRASRCCSPRCTSSSTCWSTSAIRCSTRGSATDMAAAIDIAVAPKSVSPTVQRFKDALRRHPTAIAGAIVLLLMVLVAVFAAFLGTIDPQALSPIRRLRPPGDEHWFGTDMLGRDVYSRVVYGTRVSLTVGLAVALLATTVGLGIGLVTGYLRWMDAI